MNNIQLLIIALTLIVSILAVIILWRKGILRKHKKKIVTSIITGSILSSGVVLMFTGDVIVDAGVVRGAWFKNTNYNTYFTTNTSVHFSIIDLETATGYTFFNTTCFVTDPTTRLNITIMYINSSGVTPAEDVIRLGFYSNASDPETISYIIGGFEASTDYYVNLNGTWMDDVTSNITGFITFDYEFVNDDYWVLLEVYKGTGGTASYTDTIRNDGTDYFVWLGVNTTAYWVNTTITGMNEATESISIWDRTTYMTNSGLWQTYNGTRTGVNWTVHTFDIIRTKLDDAAGSQVITMDYNPDMDYTSSQAIILVNTTTNKGYNYSAYNRVAATLLSTINTTNIGLPAGDYLAKWNRTTYAWDIWISGFGPVDHNVSRWDVIQTKVSGAETWNT